MSTISRELIEIVDGLPEEKACAVVDFARFLQQQADDQEWERILAEKRAYPKLDRFVAAMIAIREEIRRIERGDWPADDNPLKRAPHTQADLAEEPWQRPYSRREACFPLPWVADNKFWPSVNRIDDVYGDRNLFCACPPPAAYQA